MTIPTILEDDDIDWSLLGKSPQTSAPVQPTEKPLPTFHNRPRVWADNYRDWEERDE